MWEQGSLSSLRLVSRNISMNITSQSVQHPSLMWCQSLKSRVKCSIWPLMQGWLCGRAACAFKFFIFLHNLTCPPARGLEPARLFLGAELWRLGYRNAEKEFYCVVSAGQTFNPSNSFIAPQHRRPEGKTDHGHAPDARQTRMLFSFTH